MGFGTYAASVVLQLAETAEIDSFGVYPSGVLGYEALRVALAYIINHPTDYDVVLFAIPPTDYTDPVSKAMSMTDTATGDPLWDKIIDSIHASPSKTANGAMFGLPTDDQAFNDLHLSHRPYSYLQGFRIALNRWKTITGHIATINQMGLPVVVPAGDLGPAPQSIIGLANLPTVLTVGSYNPADPARSRPNGTISTSSASGPSIDHRMKPDLIASTGIVGLMPPTSTMAVYLDSVSMLDPALTPSWTASGTPTSSARAITDTTLTSAAVAAIAAGGMAYEGLRNPAKLRAALVSRSTPLDAVPVWRQGAGLLGGASLSLDIPTKLDADSTALFTSWPNFGIEPSSGSWSTTSTVVSGTVNSAAVSYKDFIGTDILAKSITSTVTATSSVPVTATTTSSQVVLSAPVGNDAKDPGVYCGYLVATSTNTSSTQSVTDELPWCLTNAIKPTARSFAIHDRSSENQTFELAPGLPPGASILNHPLHFLPVNPFSMTLFAATTTVADCIRYGSAASLALAPVDTCSGLAKFASVPVGYYKVRALADYGSPVTYTTQGSSPTTPPRSHPTDIGERFGYSSFTTLLLGRAPGCIETHGPHDDWSGQNASETYPHTWEPGIKTWKGCSEEFLYQKLTDAGRSSPEDDAPFDPATAGFTLKSSFTSATDLLVNFGYMRKAIQGAVTSRYIDIVRPCSELKFLSLRTPPLLQMGAITQAVTGTTDWSHTCNNFESLTAQLNSGPDSTGAIGLGVAAYPFKLTTPNYTAHISLNFAYELHNAFIIVQVVTAGESMAGIVTPAGVIDLSTAGPLSTLLLNTVNGTGNSAPGSKANFDWRFLPKGEVNGTIYFTFVPNQYSTNTIQRVGSWAKLKDSETSNDTLSFEMDTWAESDWPAFNYKKRFTTDPKACAFYSLPANDCGHAFEIHPNFNPWTADSSGNYKSGQIKSQLTSTGTVVPELCRQITGATQTANVCEDWTVLAHLPRPYSTDSDDTSAGLMDVIGYPTSTATPRVYTSLLQNLKDDGGKIFTPPSPRKFDRHLVLAFPGAPDPASLPTNTVGTTITTNGEFFEQLSFPMSFLYKNRRTLQVCINDHGPRWNTPTNTTISSVCAGSYSTATTPPWTPTLVTGLPMLDRYSRDPDVAPYVPYVSSDLSWPL